MSFSCYCITRHYDIFLHGYAHYAFASTIKFHSEAHRSDRNNNSVWQNYDQRRRIAREAIDRQSPSPSLSVGGNVPKNERRDFARENNHRYLCRFASTDVLTVVQKDSLLPFLYLTLIAKYIHAGTRILRRDHVEMRKIFFQLPLKREKRIPYKMISV